MVVNEQVVFLMGPTASGKTDAALLLVDRFPFEIISVDSALVYRGMDIGTSKPSREILERVPHHLIDICDPSEHYSAARFREDAQNLIRDIHANGKIPLFVGGTMLYFRALEYGMSQLPEGDENIRRQLDEQMLQNGLDSLYQELQVIDPEASVVIKSGDKQRIQRALEVFRITGQPISYWWRQENKNVLPYPVKKIALIPSDRRVLHQRIEKRFDQMLALGLVGEVETLFRRGDLSERLPSIRSVGYRQVWQMLAGQINRDQMRNNAITATRQLAKRQMTWLRSEKNIEVIPTDNEKFFDALLKVVSQSQC